MQQSIELFRQAQKLDPKFAPAWAGECASLGVLPHWVPEEEKKNTPKFLSEAETACKQALQLAPDLAEAHTALGSLYAFRWDWARAEPHMKRALELAPNDAEVYFAHSKWLGGLGRLEESLQANTRAIELDPLVPIFLNGQAFSLRVLGRNEEQIAPLRAAYAMAPGLGFIGPNLFRAYLETGRLDDAEKFLDQTRPADWAGLARTGNPQIVARAALQLARHPEQRDVVRKQLTPEQFERALFVLGDVDANLAALERDIDLHASGTDPVRILHSVGFNAYRKDPRIVRMFRKAGLDADGKLP